MASGFKSGGCVLQSKFQGRCCDKLQAQLLPRKHPGGAPLKSLAAERLVSWPKVESMGAKGQEPTLLSEEVLLGAWLLHVRPAWSSLQQSKA